LGLGEPGISPDVKGSHGPGESGLTGRTVDVRDAPELSGAEPDPSSWSPSPPRHRVPVEPPFPVRTIPAFGKILHSSTWEIPAGQTLPLRVGLHPSRLQAQHIAYLMLYASGGSVQVAGDESALPGGRATYPPGLALALDHVGGLYVWGDAASDVTVSVLVVGIG
jgi:hypothetical protein